MKKARAAGFAVAAGRHRRRNPLDPDAAASPGTLVLTRGQARGHLRRRCAGRLVELNVRDGEWVKKDTVMAKLSNPEKQTRTRQNCRRTTTSTSPRPVVQPEPGARKPGHGAPARANGRGPRAGASRRSTSRSASSTLVAPRDGQVMGVPHSRDDRASVLKPGKPFCEVGDPHHLEAHLILDQADIDLVRAEPPRLGQDLRRSETTFRARSSEIAKRNREDIPPELRNMAGGEIATKRTPRPAQIKPLNGRLRGDHPDREPRPRPSSPASAGSPRSTAGPTPSAGGSGGLIAKTFHFNL